MDPSLPWHPHPEVWFLGGGLIVAYVAAIAILGPRRVPSGRPVVTTGNKACFVAGVLLLWGAEEWPLHELAEKYLFSAHMVQHLLIAYAVPPLLLLGIPAWMFRILLGTGLRRSVYRLVSNPVIAFVLFNGAIATMHWEPVVAAQASSAGFHLFFHAALISVGMLMWSLVVDPVPELKRLTEPMKMLYLFLQSIIPTVPASFLTFTQTPLYPVYADAPRIWGIDPVTDQMVAGLLMKIGGGLLLWSVIAVLFFKWYVKEETRQDESLSWDDFERELEVWNMRK